MKAKVDYETNEARMNFGTGFLRKTLPTSSKGHLLIDLCDADFQKAAKDLHAVAAERPE